MRARFFLRTLSVVMWSSLFVLVALWFGVSVSFLLSLLFFVTCLVVLASFFVDFFSVASVLVCFLSLAMLLAFTGRLGIQTAGGHLVDYLVSWDAFDLDGNPDPYYSMPYARLRYRCRICLVPGFLIEVSVIGCAAPLYFFFAVYVNVACVLLSVPLLFLFLFLSSPFSLSLSLSLSLFLSRPFSLSLSLALAPQHQPRISAVLLANQSRAN